MAAVLAFYIHPNIKNNEIEIFVAYDPSHSHNICFDSIRCRCFGYLVYVCMHVSVNKSQIRYIKQTVRYHSANCRSHGPEDI